MELEDMSKQYSLKQLTNEELINFALEHLGEEHELIRKSALQEHLTRVKDASDTVIAPPGDVEILRDKLAQLVKK